MDSLPLTAALLGKLFPIKGSDIERYYKHHLSDYEVWTQRCLSPAFINVSGWHMDSAGGNEVNISFTNCSSQTVK